MSTSNTFGVIPAARVAFTWKLRKEIFARNLFKQVIVLP